MALGRPGWRLLNSRFIFAFIYSHWGGSFLLLALDNLNIFFKVFFSKVKHILKIIFVIQSVLLFRPSSVISSKLWKTKCLMNRLSFEKSCFSALLFFSFDLQWFAIWIFHHVYLAGHLKFPWNHTSILYREKKKDH